MSKIDWEWPFWESSAPTRTGIGTVADVPRCSHCGVHHYQNGERTVCPLAKAVEYWPDGSIKRVEW